EPVARQARQQVPEPRARGPLQAVTAQADPIEEQRHAPEQREQDHHGAAPGEVPRGAPASPGRPERRGAWGARSRPPMVVRWLVSLRVTIRGGSTTVSEALSTRRRQSVLSEQPRT